MYKSPAQRTLLESLVWADTKPTRLFLAMIDFTFAAYMWSDRSVDDMAIMVNSIPTNYPLILWSTLFALHGLALLKGLSGKFNFFTLMIEGVLGVALWGITALTNTLAQGYVPGPSTVALLMTVWLLARYPSNWGPRDD